MKQRSLEDIIAKADSLGLWDVLLPYNVALKMYGSAVPYFCSVIKCEEPTHYRICFLEGWQMMHAYVMMRVDANYGVYSSISELSGFQVHLTASEPPHVLRTDAGYIPLPVTKEQSETVARLMWEVYGLLMRLESDPQMPMRYAEDRSIFARVEQKRGEWIDMPLTIPDPPHHDEKVSFDKNDLKKAKDLPLDQDAVYELDFDLDPAHLVNGPRPHTVYELRAVDVATRKLVIYGTAIIVQDLSLAGLWESMPQHLLHEIVRIGRVPGTIRVRSARVFRLVRALCTELPFKLSLHDQLSVLPPYGTEIPKEEGTEKK